MSEYGELPYRELEDYSNMQAAQIRKKNNKIEQLQARAQELESINLGLAKTLIEMEAEKSKLVEALQAISRNELDAQRAQHVAAIALADHRNGQPMKIEEILAELRAAQSCTAEPVAIEYQHEETGQIGYIDVQQVEWGFFENNPRLQEIGPLYRHPPASGDRGEKP